jgi:hypothetical protein
MWDSQECKGRAAITFALAKAILPSIFGRQSATKSNPDMALVGKFDQEFDRKPFCKLHNTTSF